MSNWEIDDVQNWIESLLQDFCEGREPRVLYQAVNTECARNSDVYWFCPQFEWGVAEPCSIEAPPTLGMELEETRPIWAQDLQIFCNLRYLQMRGDRESTGFFAALLRLLKDLPYQAPVHGIELPLDGWSGPYTGRFGNADIKQMIVRYTFQQQ